MYDPVRVWFWKGVIVSFASYRVSVLVRGKETFVGATVWPENSASLKRPAAKNHARSFQIGPPRVAS